MSIVESGVLAVDGRFDSEHPTLRIRLTTSDFVEAVDPSSLPTAD